MGAAPTLLNAEEVDLEVCGQASTALEALEQIPNACPDLVITDLTLEGMSRLELIKHLSAQYPELPILVVSMHIDMLSDRELEIFQHLGRWHSTRTIAEAMLVSTKTVDSYRDRIKEKLGLNSHAALLQEAARWTRDETQQPFNRNMVRYKTR